MKKLMCMMTSVILATALLFTNVNAMEMQKGNVTEKFIEVSRDFFENKECYTVINSNNQNVTDEFYASNYELYLNGDFQSIWENSVDIITSFTRHDVENVPNLSRNSYLRKTVSDKIYVLETSGNPHFEFQYQIIGTFTYNANTGIISGYTSPSVSLLYTSLGMMYSCQMNNVSTGANIATNKYSISFYANFKLLVSMQTIQNGVYVTTNSIFGPYHGTVTGYPE